MEQIIEIVDSFARGNTIEALSETGRFLYIYNSTTLIASVGAIVGLILLGSLLWIAITSAAKSEKGYSYGSSGYRKIRSNTDYEEKTHTFIELLAMLDETFQKMRIHNFDCQKRAVCEAHQPQLHSDKKSIAPFIRRITYIFGKFDDKALDALEPESADFLFKYFEAADKGRNSNNCSHLYATCPMLKIFNPFTQNSV